MRMISKLHSFKTQKNSIYFSYMLLADYAEYIKAQERVDELYKVNKRKTKHIDLFACLLFRIDLNGRKNVY